MVGLPPHKRGIGVVFQNYALFPHMTVAQNLRFPLQMQRTSKAAMEERVAEALELVRLEGYASRFPRELSGGQQQRVALARALVFSPSVLLMDEPLGALDRRLREHMQGELRALHRRLGVTVVYVTHDQQEALTLSDQLAVMDAGRVMQVGTPGEIYSRPRTRFVAEFFGDCNFLSGRVAQHELGTTLTTELGETFLGPPSAPENPANEGALVLRPEAIAFESARTPPSNGAVNKETAVVQEVVYLGDTLRVLLRTRTGRSLIAKVLSTDDVPRVPGQPCNIWWRADSTSFVAG
jgi:putative spermidine/putrescine transport system ATP-binding protein